jgi:hypothetical protein
MSLLRMMTTASLVLGLLVVSAQAQAFGKKVTCKVTTNDIGTIVGKGRSFNAAFEDAAEQCFERRAQLHRLKNNADLDEDTGLVVIDTCANIQCGS